MWTLSRSLCLRAIRGWVGNRGQQLVIGRATTTTRRAMTTTRRAAATTRLLVINQ